MAASTRELRVAIPLSAPTSLAHWVRNGPASPPAPERTRSGLTASVSSDPDVVAFALRRTGLFAHASAGALAILTAAARHGELPSGEVLFNEGAPADSFFVVIEGSLEVLKSRGPRQVALRHESGGGVFGVFGLVSGAQREATVRAISDATLLELPASVLRAALAEDGALLGGLEALHQERILEMFVGASGLFTDVDAIARGRLLSRFIRKTWPTGAVLVSPGEVGHALAVVLSGSLHLELPSRAGGVTERLVLHRGQFIAVTGALAGMPTRVRISTAEPSALAVLKHREMADVVRDYPALRSLPSKLPGAATEIAPDVFCGNV